jgi:glycerophosphoryl diester phosphodiesterase
MQKQRAIHPYLSPALPRIFAHRGFAIAEGVSENTIEAFRAALALGASHLESDVQVSKDGVPVLFHDYDLKRVAGLPRKINEYLASELAGIALIGGGSIPTLRQALIELPEARFNLDLKVSSAVEAASAVIHELKAEHRVLLASFSDRRRTAAVRLSQTPIASSAGSTRVLGLWLASKLRNQSLMHRLASPIEALQIPTSQWRIRFDSPRFIADMTKVGLELHFWTINEPHEMLRLIALGAHGIVTDRTEIAVKTLRMAS